MNYWIKSIQLLTLIPLLMGSGGIHSLDDRSNLPVFRGAQGFGTTTPAGRHGEIIKVTNLNDSGPGSLRSAVEANSPRTIVFELSGRINLRSNLILKNPYCTIAGQTAPSPGIMITDRMFVVQSHDVLVQHVSFRVGDEGKSADAKWNSTDAIQIIGQSSYNIVFDHISTSWAIDENIGIGYGVKNITFSNCIISEPLYTSINTNGYSGYGILIADNSTRVCFIGNLIAHAKARLPRIQSASVLLVNNIFYNKGGLNFIEIGAGVETQKKPSYLTAIGNLFIDGPSGMPGHAIAEGKIVIESAIYQHDNLYKNGTVYKGKHAVNTPPSNTWTDSRLNPPTQVDRVKLFIMQRAGSRPSERDDVDKRIICDLYKGTGRIIGSQIEVGGFPVLTENRRFFDVGTNPNGDDNGDGYTNIEERLQQLANEVEKKLS